MRALLVRYRAAQAKMSCHGDFCKLASVGPVTRRRQQLAASSMAFFNKHPRLTTYIAVSLAVAVLLFIDPLFNKPNGLITTSLFTGRSASHGSEPCSYDYEGSWQIGVLSGASPLTASISNRSVLSCLSIANTTAVSYVAEPFLVLPATGNSSWFYAFYQMKNLVTSKGEIGVAASLDQGVTWQHLGTALSERFSLSSPWVTYDPDSKQYVMIPDTHKSRDNSVQLYTTTPADFPFGWVPSKVAVAGARFLDISAVQHGSLWWIYTTVKDKRVWGQEPSYNLKLYYAETLLGDWTEHPLSPISGDLRYARSGGRPFVMNGTVFRWSQDDSDFFGESLHLFKVDMLSTTEYMESFVKSVEPSGSSNWYTARTHHIDIQQLNDTWWFGLVDGDQYRDGTHHFYHHEARFVRLKNALLKLVLVQLVFVVTVFTVWQFSDQLSAVMFGKGSSCSCWGRQTLATTLVSILPELALLRIMVLAVVGTFAVFGAFPSAFFCPRWNVRVDVINTPPVTHVDTHAPYNVSDLVVITGATASFFDRVTNMIGSVHVWEPNQHIIVYDLGFSQSQLAKMMCWRNVEIRRFPYEDYPPHVRDVRNYAFKTLAILEAFKTNQAVLWIDSGLELRAPMDKMRREMAQHGHVSAMQEDLIGDPMYTMTKNQVDFFGLSDEWEEIRKWQFCAGGLQGFVRGSDADQLVLRPSVNCSLHELECIAPPGSSRKNHNFDQTALTIMIWRNNFSCLPRETHCMWSVKKTSRDPLQLSTPIEVVSRGHRLPKPYTTYISSKEDCVPDKAKVPWPALGLEHQESLSRYNLTFKLSHVYLQPIGDLVVMSCACIGSHSLMQALYWAQLGAVWLGLMDRQLRKAWVSSRLRLALHLTLGTCALAATQLVSLYIFSQVH